MTHMRTGHLWWASNRSRYPALQRRALALVVVLPAAVRECGQMKGKRGRKTAKGKGKGVQSERSPSGNKTRGDEDTPHGSAEKPTSSG